MDENQIGNPRAAAHETPEAADKDAGEISGMMNSVEGGFLAQSPRAAQVQELFIAGTAAANNAAGDPEAGRAAWEAVQEHRATAERGM